MDRHATHTDSSRQPAARGQRAFTLVEILIVVVILGILAATVVPSFANAIEPSERSAFATSLRSFAQSTELYRVQEGGYPQDSTSGEIPDGLEDYIDVSTWRSETPIGGLWDSESELDGAVFGIGVHFMTDEPRDSVYMTELDALIDNGDLTTGGFQQFEDDRFYLVLQFED
ncbi:MAG: prepilin-type N-terminal cleavage/methylation domain-containing protein [Planctomycetota bacterium]